MKLRHVFFPEISFSGYVSRTAFLGELVTAFIMTPIMYGVAGNVFAVVKGLEPVSYYTLLYLAPTLLSLFALRNTIALAGLVKRRMNDVGLTNWHVLQPLAVIFAVSAMSPIGFVFGPLYFIVVMVVMLWVIQRIGYSAVRIFTYPGVAPDPKAALSAPQDAGPTYGAEPQSLQDFAVSIFNAVKDPTKNGNKLGEVLAGLGSNKPDALLKTVFGPASANDDSRPTDTSGQTTASQGAPWGAVPAASDEIRQRERDRRASARAVRNKKLSTAPSPTVSHRGNNGRRRVRTGQAFSIWRLFS